MRYFIEAAMGRMTQMESHKMPGNHVFDVFNTIPMISLQSLPQARPPQLRIHQPPVLQRYSPAGNLSFNIHNRLHTKEYSTGASRCLSGILKRIITAQVRGTLLGSSF